MVLGILSSLIEGQVSIHSVSTLSAVVGGVIIVAYVIWHYTASPLLERRYDRVLFAGCRMSELGQFTDAHDGPRDWPRVMINATSLNGGDHLVFTHYVRQGKPGSDLIDAFVLSHGASRADDAAASAKDTSNAHHKVLFRGRPPIPMDGNTSIAHAVTASSAFPGVFTPLPLTGLLAQDHLLRRAFPVLAATYQAVDGGVFDNQGTQVLLDGRCRAILVSDGAAALRPIRRPSTWQVFPFGQGVVSRTHDIIYERVRDLGYKRLADRSDLSRRLEQAGQLKKAVADDAPILEGYAYIELRPS